MSATGCVGRTRTRPPCTPASLTPVAGRPWTVPCRNPSDYTLFVLLLLWIVRYPKRRSDTPPWAVRKKETPEKEKKEKKKKHRKKKRRRRKEEKKKDTCQYFINGTWLSVQIISREKKKKEKKRRNIFFFSHFQRLSYWRFQPRLFGLRNRSVTKIFFVHKQINFMWFWVRKT